MGGRTNGTWKKGMASPNPSGRPRVDPEVVKAMRTALESPEMVMAWREGYQRLLEAGEPSIIRDYADRMLGKATDLAAVPATPPSIIPVRMTDDEIDDLAAAPDPDEPN